MKRTVAQVMAVIFLVGVLLSCTTGCSQNKDPNRKHQEIINVSYDPTRELYRDYNQVFRDWYFQKTGIKVDVVQSHGGSGKQALEVANGLQADVVTLALEADVDAVKDAGLIRPGYINRLPKSSSPYTSTIVFLVRKGNPKKIYDWNDLVRKGVQVITPNPKTSGGARWNYLAAWYYFEKQGLNESQILEKMRQLYQNVIVLDSGARGSTTTFVENGQGDVLIAWENEAFLTLEQNPGEYELVVPSASILCQPTVAEVDAVTRQHGTQKTAEAYLKYLYSNEAQKLEAKHFFRPTSQTILRQYQDHTKSRIIRSVPKNGHWIITNIDLTNIDHFGGWQKTTAKHFADGGLFDQIYTQ